MLLWLLGSPRDLKAAPRPHHFNVLFFCRILHFLEVDHPDSAQYAKGRDGLEKSPLYYLREPSLHLRRFVTMRVPAGFDRRASGDFLGTQTPKT